ncbi:MAG: molybdopterin molybdotransferase MoeA [Magnetococcales bacterium]|nr:molybdopterin molybdotransferase MoeA [Magnetococcales bacterium]MBF0148781.1 molybdopterin molybdotransferase MoeA [Magnetococcales bacterium]
MGDPSGGQARMISFEEAEERILAYVVPVTGTEVVGLEQAPGRILAEAVVARINVPNHANSAMDGYAVASADLVGTGQVRLRVVFDLAAGGFYSSGPGRGEAVRIMTGAPIPPGADTVVIQEVCRREGEWVEVPCGIPRGEHVRDAGEDMRVGMEVLDAGKRLRPGDIGVLAAQGIDQVTVFRRIRVGLFSTGNEVVEVAGTLRPGQVYDSNRAGLKAALGVMGCAVIDFGIVGDDLAAIESVLQRAAHEVDVIISTGGVSVGDYDLVRTALANKGEIGFWQVAMKPGKPQAYGRLGGAVFFGLPGNPVSGLTVFHLLIRPALFRLMGGRSGSRKRIWATFTGQWTKKHSRKEFLRAILDLTGEGPKVKLTGPQGSGLMTSLARANAFMVLPEGPVTVSSGDRVEVWMMDNE